MRSGAEEPREASERLPARVARESIVHRGVGVVHDSRVTVVHDHEALRVGDKRSVGDAAWASQTEIKSTPVQRRLNSVETETDMM